MRTKIKSTKREIRGTAIPANTIIDPSNTMTVSETPPPADFVAFEGTERTKREILTLIDDRPGLDYVDIASSLNLRLRTAVSLVNELVAEGRLAREEADADV